MLSCRFIFSSSRFFSRLLFVVVAVLSINFVLAQSVFAQSLDELLDLSLEDLLDLRVTTASRYEQELDYAPGIINAISQEEMNSYGALQLRDVVDRLPAVVSNFDELRQYSSIMVRGDLRQQNRVLTLINGRPLRSLIGGASSNGFFLNVLPVNSLERVEFVRGPGSVLYGSGAMSGVLNVITRKPTNSAVDVSLQAGSFGGRNATLSGEYLADSVSGMLTVHHFDSDGWPAEFTLPDPAGGVREIDMRFGEQNKALNAQLYWGGWGLDFHYADSDVVGQRLDLTTTTHETGFANLAYKTDLSADWQSQTHLTWHSDKNEFDRSVIEGESLLLESFVTYSFLSDSKLVMGLSAEHEQFDIFDAFATEPPFNIPARSYGDNANLYLLYAQFDTQLSQRLQLTLGAQVNKSEGLSGDFVPRLGLIYHFTERWGSKLLYSEAYRSPDSLERWLDSTFVKGDNELKPEKVKTLDWQWFARGENHRSALTLFYSKYRDLIAATSFDIELGEDGLVPISGSFINKDKLEIYGAELEGDWQALERLMINASYSWQRNKDDEGLQNVTGAPTWMAKLGARYHFQSGVTLGSFVSYVGAYKNTTKRGATLTNPVPESYALLSLNALIDLAVLFNSKSWQGLSLELLGQNLLDEEIHHTNGGVGGGNSLPAYAPRAGYLKLRYRYQ